MDPVTQGAVGSALATAAAPRDARWMAAGLGWVAGMAADLDVLIRSSSDPLLFLEYHRQFTHALVFVPAGALVCAGVTHWLVRRRLSFRATYLFCLLGYASHGLLDACTSYGTQLLWPFSDVRIAWNHVSVVDPLFTLPLLTLLAVALVRDRAWPARLGVCWCLLYLAFGALQHERARAAALELAAARGHSPDRLVAKPSFGNQLLWKTVYQSSGRYHVDAVRLGARTGYFPGDSIRALDPASQLPWVAAGSRQGRDLERFRRFSQDFLAVDPDHPGRVIDVRYSLLPNRIQALWGIQLDPQDTRAPAAFVTDRRSTDEQRRALLEMLRSPGFSLPEAALQKR